MSHKKEMNFFRNIKFFRNIRKPEKRRIGLALSGGGMRGVAHLGVVKLLEENSLYPDMIAATSAGSVVGSIFALGIKAEDAFTYLKKANIREIMRRSYRREFSLKQGSEHVSKKGAALIAGDVVEQVLLDFYGEKTFADVKIPFLAIASDIYHMEEVVLEEGLLARACSASSAIPGVFSPVQEDERVLVDGMLFNNLPADVLRKRGMDKVVSVNLKAAGVEGVKSLRFTEVIGVSLDIMSYATMHRGIEQTDLMISPDLRGFGTYSLSDGALQEMFDIGYEAAKGQLSELKAVFGGSV